MAFDGHPVATPSFFLDVSAVGRPWTLSRTTLPWFLEGRLANLPRKVATRMRAPLYFTMIRAS